MKNTMMTDNAKLLTELNAVADEAASLLGCMANPDRLMLLCMLVQGERNVSELRDLTGIEQPTLSQQLTVLRNEGLAQTRKAGKYVYYRIGNPDVLRIMQTLYDIFCAPGRSESAPSLG